MGIIWTDLVNHPHVNLQDVRDVHYGRGGGLESQTEVVNHHLHPAWMSWRHLESHNREKLILNIIIINTNELIQS